MELFSIRIQRTFQLVSTEHYALSDFYLLNNHSLFFFSKNVSLHWGYVFFGVYL